MLIEPKLLRAMLNEHVSTDASEEASRQKILAFLEQTASPYARETLEGHVTAAAVVLDQNGRALLLFHARLEQWLQPGGHMEAGESPAEAALREAQEESHLPDLALDLDASGLPRLLDIDVHPIPAHPKKQEPAHWHYDLCYVARTRHPDAARVDPNESHDSRWVTAPELQELGCDPATRRRLMKAFARGR